MSINVEKIRNDFPILSQKIYGKPLIYFDNGATTQKPLCVLETEKRLYSEINANIHRGVHFLSQKSTELYEESRNFIKNWLNAKFSHEIIFTKGTTEGINLVAASFGEKFINEGDEILITEMEHHSNIVPWQILCERKKAILKVLPFDENGELCLEKLSELLNSKTRLVSFTQISNSLGTINPVKKIIQEIRKFSKEIVVLVDGAQAVSHFKIDVQELDCDFYVFSGHKIYAPTGIGVLYGKEKWLDAMPPYQGGGDMIKTVSFSKTVYADLPFKFEAGTPNFIGAITLKTSLNYLNDLGIENIASYENDLLKYSLSKLNLFSELRLIGNAKNRSSIISFILNKIHPYDTGMILDKMGIAVRTGTHCTEPVMQHFKITGTVRASLSFYNTESEVDVLISGIQKVIKMFSVNE